MHSIIEEGSLRVLSELQVVEYDLRITSLGEIIIISKFSCRFELKLPFHANLPSYYINSISCNSLKDGMSE